MKQIVIRIPDKKYSFFIELIKQLGFEVYEKRDLETIQYKNSDSLKKEKLAAFEESIPEWQMKEVKQRLEDYKKNPDQVLDFDSAMDDIEKEI